MASGPPAPPPPPDFTRQPGMYPAPGSPPGSAAGEANWPYAAGGWLPPASLPSGGFAGEPGRPRPAAMYELRPLSTGELLDRTFSLYRSRFWLFAGISAMAAVFQTAGQAAQLVTQHVLLKRGNILTVTTTGYGFAGILSILFWLVLSLTQAATVWAVSEVYLRRAATVKDALGAVLPRWSRFMGIALWQVGSFVWLPFAAMAVFGGAMAWLGRSQSALATGVAAFFLVLAVIAAVVVGFLFYLRNLLGVPVAALEQVKARPAMRRSKQLAGGAKGKLFLILLISALLLGVVSGIAGLLLLLGLIPGIAGKWQIFAQVIGLGVNFLGYTVVSPVVMVGVTLTYFDQRVRKEAFDVAVLLGDYATPLFGGPIPGSAQPGSPTRFDPMPGGSLPGNPAVSFAAGEAGTQTPPLPLQAHLAAEPHARAEAGEPIEGNDAALL